MRKIAVFTLLLFLVYACPSRAEETAVLTLPQAVDQALKYNKNLDNIRKSVEESELKYRAARKEHLPKINTVYTYFRLGDDLNVTSTDPTTGDSFTFPVMTRENYTWITSFNLPIYMAGAIKLNEDIVRLGIDISKLRLLQARNELVQAVKCYYFNILRDDKLVVFFEQNLKTYLEHERVTRHLHEQGQVARNTLLAARVETLNARQELATARRNADISRSALNIAMGWEVNHPLVVEEELERKPFDLSLNDCLEVSRKNNPELVAFAFLKQQAEKAVRMETAHYIPTLDLSVNYMANTQGKSSGEEFMPNNILYSMLNLRWNIIDWGQKADEASSKRKNLEQVINNEKIVRDAVMMRVKEAQARLGTAAENIETAALALVEAKENVRIASLRYREQVAPASEVTDAMAALKKAELNHASALYDYNAAVAALECAMGADIQNIIGTVK
jgi:outer membrane protein TolC